MTYPDHIDYPESAWVAAKDKGETTLKYWEWVDAQILKEEDFEDLLG